MKKIVRVLLSLIIFFVQLQTFASNLCTKDCSFALFFKYDFEKLIKYLKPNDEVRHFYNILFNAYLIKFEGLDFEYKIRCQELEDNKNSDEIKAICIKEQKNYIKELAKIAEEEYDNFLDDLNFELCGCENFEEKNIKKNKKRYKKALKKCIASNCK